jgi:hypothetical protein
MKATFIRKYQKPFWTSGTWKIFVDHDGSTIEIENGDQESLELTKGKSILTLHIANELSIPVYSKQVVLKEEGDITFNLKIKGISKPKLDIKADKKIKIRNF